MKKTRLLEIIREEISSALKQTNLINEDTLMEAPFIEGALDFSYINGELEKGILGKAIANATQEIKKSFPEIDPKSAAEIIKSKKSRTAEKTPEAIKSALAKVDDAIDAQVKTFDDASLLKNLLNKGEIGKTKEEIEQINKFIEPNENGDRKSYTTTLGFPQTLRAVEKTLQDKSPVDVEPKTTTKKSEPTTEKPAKETTKKAEEPKAKKAEEPKAKESEEDKATKRAKTGGSKLDRMANDQEALLKAKKAAEEERLAIAEKRRNTEDVKEREKLLDDLKRIGKLEGEIQKKLDNLGY